jgi:CheY-like chemotaxis protein
MAGLRTVLVVEDEELVRAMTARILTREGYRVVQAQNGVEALEVLKRESGVELVLTDIVMPRMDGFQLATHIDAISKVPILFMTGYGQGHTATTRPVLYKPFTPSSLAAQVLQLLPPQPRG